MSVIVFFWVIFGLVVLLSTVVLGVVISPEIQAELFTLHGKHANSTECKSFYDNKTDGKELCFDPNDYQTQLLASVWRDEMDASFETIFHTFMTLYTTTTYSNYYKIFGLLWTNEFSAEHDGTNQIGQTGLLPAKIIATSFIIFYMLFMLCTDCILLAVCVQGEHSGRAK